MLAETVYKVQDGNHAEVATTVAALRGDFPPPLVTLQRLQWSLPHVPHRSAAHCLEQNFQCPIRLSPPPFQAQTRLLLLPDFAVQCFIHVQLVQAVMLRTADIGFQVSAG